MNGIDAQPAAVGDSEEYAAPQLLFSVRGFKIIRQKNKGRLEEPMRNSCPKVKEKGVKAWIVNKARLQHYDSEMYVLIHLSKNRSMIS